MTMSITPLAFIIFARRVVMEIRMGFEGWVLEGGCWRVGVGGWVLKGGCWRMGVEGWVLEGGC